MSNEAEFEQLIGASIRGAFVIRGDRGIKFNRLPAWTFPQHAHAPIVAKVAGRLSGARLEFETAATDLVITYRSTRDTNLTNGWVGAPSIITVTSDGFEESIGHDNGNLEVYNDDQLVETIAGEDSVARFSLPSASEPRLVQIWLPHTCPIELIAIDSDAPLAPAARTKPKWVHYGSSISHCEEANVPTGVWPAIVARELGLDLYSLGLGGCANLEQFAARTIRELPSDFISLKLGINVVNGATMTARTFAPAVHGFLDTIRETRPDVPILVISPICCPAHENNPGPTMAGPDGKAAGQEFGPHTWIGELTLRHIRATLEALVAQRSATDPNLYYMNGLELFGEAEAETMPDGLHPDSDGYARIAANFIAGHPAQWLQRSN
jgi:GDSL-like Lipase/Acylhydrolase family